MTSRLIRSGQSNRPFSSSKGKSDVLLFAWDSSTKYPVLGQTGETIGGLPPPVKGKICLEVSGEIRKVLNLF